MNKIVVNKCYGGFSLSTEATEYMGLEVDKFARKYGSFHTLMSRHDPKLVAAVEALGSEAASGSHAKLEVEVIKGTFYQIGEYDGMEWIETPESQEWIEIE